MATPSRPRTRLPGQPSCWPRHCSQVGAAGACKGSTVERWAVVQVKMTVCRPFTGASSQHGSTFGWRRDIG